jgi:hypothetical protein
LLRFPACDSWPAGQGCIIAFPNPISILAIEDLWRGIAGWNRLLPLNAISTTLMVKTRKTGKLKQLRT